MIRIVETNRIYENPLPQLRSVHSYFPNLAELENGDLAAVHVLGEAFESVDGSSYISFSRDGGKNWTSPQPMFDKSGFGVPVTDYCKITVLPDGRLAAFGYAFPRSNPDLPLGNRESGGLLDSFVFYSVSEDHGRTWGPMQKISCTCGTHAEASAPVTVLHDGTWISPITGFPDWNGKLYDKICGRAMRSTDSGKTWSDESVCMEFQDEAISCYEQRMCQLSSGTVVCIGWNEDLITGERYDNHYTYSCDNGKSWSRPFPTGIRGQASSVCSLGDNRLLALHSIRRDTDHPGILGCIVDFSGHKWKIVEKQYLWEPSAPLQKNSKLADIFSYVKFGQPSAIVLRDGDIMMSFWYAEDGQYKTAAARLRLG